MKINSGDMSVSSNQSVPGDITQVNLSRSFRQRQRGYNMGLLNGSGTTINNYCGPERSMSTHTRKHLGYHRLVEFVIIKLLS